MRRLGSAILFLLLAAAGGFAQGAPGDQFLFLRHIKYVSMDRVTVYRCLAVANDGRFRLERVEEDLGRGLRTKVWQGQFPEADVAAMKKHLESPEFHQMQLPPIAEKQPQPQYEREAIDLDTPLDQKDILAVQNTDGRPPIPKPLKQTVDWIKRAEKLKPQELKGESAQCRQQ